jgi:8-oxo-dGTP pyrophosphatase MutT (NUDIX family)
MRLPIQIAVYCVSSQSDDHQYLLLRRPPSLGSYWQGISGGVEDDEDYLTTAKRELFEETGFVPSEIRQIDFTFTFPVPDDMRQLYDEPVEIIKEIVFLARVEDALTPVLSPIEHDAWIWCSYDEAMKRLYWRGNKESLKQCERYLRFLKN